MQACGRGAYAANPFHDQRVIVCGDKFTSVRCCWQALCCRTLRLQRSNPSRTRRGVRLNQKGANGPLLTASSASATHTSMSRFGSMVSCFGKRVLVPDPLSVKSLVCRSAWTRCRHTAGCRCGRPRHDKSQLFAVRMSASIVPNNHARISLWRQR